MARYMLVMAGTTSAVDGPVLADLDTAAGQNWLGAMHARGLDAVPEASAWTWAPGYEPEVAPPEDTPPE